MLYKQTYPQSWIVSGNITQSTVIAFQKWHNQLQMEQSLLTLCYKCSAEMVKTAHCSLNFNVMYLPCH